MEELVNLVSEKTGISVDLAQEAVEVVLSYLKDRLPDSIAGRLDDLIEGGGNLDDLGDIAGKVGGLFG